MREITLIQGQSVLIGDVLVKAIAGHDAIEPASRNPFASLLPRAVPELSKEDVRRIADSVAATLVEPGSKFCRSMEGLYDLSRRRP